MNTLVCNSSHDPIRSFSDTMFGLLYLLGGPCINVIRCVWLAVEHCRLPPRRLLLSLSFDFRSQESNLISCYPRPAIILCLDHSKKLALILATVHPVLLVVLQKYLRF